MQSNVPTLLSKIVAFKPKVVCVVGVGIAEAIHSYFSVTTSRKSTLSTKAKAKTTSSTTCHAKLGGPGLLSFKLIHDLEPPADSSTASASDTSVAEAPSARGTVQETLFYAVSSTSGRVVRYQVRSLLVWGILHVSYHRVVSCNRMFNLGPLRNQIKSNNSKRLKLSWSNCSKVRPALLTRGQPQRAATVWWKSTTSSRPSRLMPVSWYRYTLLS
jgi:hypothetical protein